MLALYRSGRQAEALRAYQGGRRALSEELGLEPRQALRDLETAILRQDASLASGHGHDTPTAAPSPVAPRPATTGDELRPVTALFADIVGSTALGERLAPEDVKALVGECVTQMSQAVEEYGGTVQAYEGDGICAYFGVPAAHEDDPERAARTALRILEVVGEYAHDIAEAWAIPDFAVRVGINTGRVGVGPVGADSPQTVALGDAVNVAARLQSAAAPGTIAVGGETARRLEHRFTFEPVGELEVKGRAEPVSASRLVGPRAVAHARRLRATRRPRERGRAPAHGRRGLWGRPRAGAPPRRRAGHRQDTHARRAALVPPRAGRLARGQLPLLRRAAVLAVHRGAAALARRRARGRGGRGAYPCAGPARAAPG